MKRNLGRPSTENALRRAMLKGEIFSSIRAEIDKAKEEGKSQIEIDQLAMGLIRRHEADIFGAIGVKLNRSQRRMPLKKLVQRMAEQIPQNLTVGQAYDSLDDELGLRDFAFRMVTSDSPYDEPLPEAFCGDVETIYDDGVPFVYSVLSPFSDLEKTINKIRDHFAKLPGANLPRPSVNAG